jgi:hypothetical protein
MLRALSPIRSKTETAFKTVTISRKSVVTGWYKAIISKVFFSNAISRWLIALSPSIISCAVARSWSKKACTARPNVSETSSPISLKDVSKSASSSSKY